MAKIRQSWKYVSQIVVRLKYNFHQIEAKLVILSNLKTNKSKDQSKSIPILNQARAKSNTNLL
jgi:hypothetical protein